MKSISAICWYLAALWLFALLATSAMTVVPDGGTGLDPMTAFSAVCSIVFTALALVFRRSTTPAPTWLLRAFQGLAIIATIVVLLVVVA